MNISYLNLVCNICLLIATVFPLPSSSSVYRGNSTFKKHLSAHDNKLSLNGKTRLARRSKKKPSETPKLPRKLLNSQPAASCSDINWASWSNFNGTNATGTVNDNGTNVNVTMTSNFQFGSTSSIYNFTRFSGYPSPIPNTTVPETTWAGGASGTTSMCFSQTVTNPVLLIASLGSSAPVSTTISFSLPYVVLYDGGGMVFNNSTTLTGTEGYAIIMFPGSFSCVTINSSTPEFYTNITWGLRPPPFNINITETSNSCGSDVLTADGGINYLWNGGDTPNQPTNTFHQSGTYIVTVTNATGCTTSTSKTITVNTMPSAAIAETTDACGDVMLTASGGTSYLWNGGDTPNQAANVFHQSGTYQVTVTNAGGCSSTISKTVVVNPSIAPAITEVSNTCGNVVLTATGGAAYSWNGGDTPNQATNTFHQDGTYAVTVTSSAGCTAKASSKVTLNQSAPAITGFSIPQQAEPPLIDNINRTVAVKVNENTDLTHLTPVITLSEGTVAPSSGTTINFTDPVTLTVSNACSSVTYKVAVSVVVPQQIFVCQNAINVLLPGTVFTTGAVYQWQIYANGSWNNIPIGYNALNYLLPTPAPSSSTQIVSYRCMVTAGGTISYDPYYDVYFTPVVTNNQITADKTVLCADDNLQVNFAGDIPAGGGAEILYFWQQSTDNSNWVNIDNETKQSLQYTFSTKQSLYFRRRIYSAGCENFSNSVLVTYSGAVTTADAGMDQSLCGTQQIVLSANPPVSDEKGTWSVISPASFNPFNTSTINNPNATIEGLPPDVPITLQWTIVKSQCNLQSSSTVTVRNNSIPTVDAGSPVTINVGQKTTLSGQITGSYANFAWSPAAGLNDPYSLNPVASPLHTTVYKLMATTNAGCTVEDSLQVTVHDQFEIPNTFTPNGDGINDTWNIPQLADYPNCRVDIYNRYGSLLFRSASYTKPWDGTYKGKPVPIGTYYYLIYLDVTKFQPMAGVLTVLR
jgi:gliding motility-associated-like protein